MKINRIDHVSVNVNDLSAAKAFFFSIWDLKCKGNGKWKESGWVR